MATGCTGVPCLYDGLFDSVTSVRVLDLPSVCFGALSMPSPFPGMDPYLEDPPRWGGVHAGLIAQISFYLNAVLPPRYAADIGERVWVVRPERSVYPDVAVVESRPGEVLRAPAAEQTVLAADPPWVIVVEEAEVRETFVDVVLIGDPASVVTTIEVLSPTNKSAGSQGRELYLRKQREILESQTHLLEIDLLRSGTYTIAAPRASLGGRSPWQYLACLHRAGSRGRFEVWATSLRDRLPRIAVPLLGEDPDVVLDLQEVFSRMYDQGPYRRRIEYAKEPPVPLAPSDAEFAHDLLVARGLRLS